MIGFGGHNFLHISCAWNKLNFYIFWFIVFIKVFKVTIIPSSTFFCLSHTSFRHFYVRLIKVVPQLTDAILCIFKILFPPRALSWTASGTLFSSSLIFPSSRSYLLLIPFSVFFLSDFFVFITRSLICFFKISFMLLHNF